MFLTNRENVAKTIEVMIEELSLLRQMVEKQDEDSLRDSVEKAKNKRELIQDG
jgi:prephenate dehydrogenase